LGYQTNFGSNHSLTASLILPAFWLRRHIISEEINYERLQAISANTHFTSYRALVRIGNVQHVGLLRQFIFLVGGGHATYHSLTTSETKPASGFGYSLGLQNYYYKNPFQLGGTIQASRWAGYWQWQAQLVHPFSFGIKAGITLNYLRDYTEVTALISYELY